ncbi:hypothetical protein AB431_15415 [Mycobacterium sp. EPa45]|nr:hypothetical protein AB431_15415 [Mycobacterium sp. EPa45]
MAIRRHYGNAKLIETNETTVVSINLAFLQVPDDNIIETGHLLLALCRPVSVELSFFAMKLSFYGLWSVVSVLLSSRFGVSQA